MTEANNHNLLTDYPDSLVYMLFRRVINEVYAEIPVDFNYEGFVAAEALAGRRLNPQDTIIDIGSSSGIMAARGAVDSGTEARVVCVEPDEEAAEAYGRLQPTYRQRVSYIRGSGESLPFTDNSVQGASMHNVIFRARSAHAMLQEAKRVVKPGGSITLSSNARGHAIKRHCFESMVAKETRARTHTDFAIPKPPAEGEYLEDIPDLIREVGGLAVIDALYVAQNTRAIITPEDRLFDYIQSIKFSAANTNIPAWARPEWHQVVDDLVEPQIQAEIAQSANSNGIDDPLRTRIGPYFSDSIMRGMFVLQVTE